MQYKSSSAETLVHIIIIKVFLHTTALVLLQFADFSSQQTVWNIFVNIIIVEMIIYTGIRGFISRIPNSKKRMEREERRGKKMLGG